MRTKPPAEIKIVDCRIRAIYRQRANGINREVVRTLAPADAVREGLALLAAAQEVAAVTGEVLNYAQQ